MKQYARVQLKYEQAYRACDRARSRRRQKYWVNVCKKIMNKKPTRQIQQEIKELEAIFASIL